MAKETYKLVEWGLWGNIEEIRNIHLQLMGLQTNLELGSATWHISMSIKLD